MSFEIIKPGLCSSIQDQGRYGYQAWGIGPGGAMDRLAAATANFIAGNEATLPVLEMGYPAATIRFTQDAVISITGADFSPFIDDIPVVLWKPLPIKAGATLRFSNRQWGNWCYLAVRGGFDIPVWLNSYSTNIRAGAGGFAGRRLQSGDLLPIILFTGKRENNTNWSLGHDWQRWYQAPVQVLPGSDWAGLNDDARAGFTGVGFGISPQSDRMGYVLTGPTLSVPVSSERISAAVTRGTVQLLPSGQCIVLMADHQTTGGYPHIATVTQHSLPALAQHSFTHPVKFSTISPASAEDVLFSMHQWMQQVRTACLQKYNCL